MFAPYRSNASLYRQVGIDTAIESASPHRLIEMLFEGGLSSIQRARNAIETRDIARKSEAMTKAIRIIDEGLKASLDERGGQLAAQLKALYEYISVRLLTASARNDVEILDECHRLLAVLADAWSSIPEQDRNQFATHAAA